MDALDVFLLSQLANSAIPFVADIAALSANPFVGVAPTDTTVFQCLIARWGQVTTSGGDWTYTFPTPAANGYIPYVTIGADEFNTGTSLPITTIIPKVSLSSLSQLTCWAYDSGGNKCDSLLVSGSVLLVMW
jgi:hypothetical protein